MRPALRSFAFCSLFLSGCATYHLSTEELLTQFADSRPETKRMVVVAAPYLFFPTAVAGNDLRIIRVYDKVGKPVDLPVTFKTSVRFTKADGTRTTFYFNTLLLQDSTITGSKTHFFNWQIKPIPFRDIRDIMVQRH